jgi:hypothetical protein
MFVLVLQRSGASAETETTTGDEAPERHWSPVA